MVTSRDTSSSNAKLHFLLNPSPWPPSSLLPWIQFWGLSSPPSTLLPASS